MKDDETLPPWSEPLPAVIPPDTYDAIVVSAKKVTRYGLLVIEFGFSLVTLKLLMILAAFFFVAPVVTHALAPGMRCTSRGSKIRRGRYCG